MSGDDAIRRTDTLGLALAQTICVVEEPRAAIKSPAAFNTATGCIHVDPLRMGALMAEHGPSIVVGAMAHEVGHRMQWRDGRDFDEEEADRVAICVLERAGMYVGWVLGVCGPLRR